MTYPQYKSDLQRIHESEVYGVALFDMAAKLTRDSVRKQKWLALKALEAHTLDRYLAHMQATGQRISEPSGWALKGRAEGAALALMPWRLAMKLLHDGTAPFQEKFLRLKAHASEADQPFFAYVYAHEKAIEAFAKQEMLGNTDSLKAVQELLTR